jgi:hypothetical protein
MNDGRLPRLVLAALLAAATLLSGCHDMVNPIDPGSTTYTGEEALREPAAVEPMLPAIVSWESVAEHGPGQYLGLAIDEDGSFVEPRQPSDPQLLYVVVTFEEPVYPEQLKDAMIFVRIVSNGTIRTERVLALVDPVRRTIAIEATPPFPPFFNTTGDGIGGATIRVLIVDPTGVELGERVFGVLPGDFDGDGTVSAADDWTVGAAAYAGRLADAADPLSVRADADADGTITAGTLDQDIAENRNVGQTLPAPPPEF